MGSALSEPCYTSLWSGADTPSIDEETLDQISSDSMSRLSSAGSLASDAPSSASHTRVDASNTLRTKRHRIHVADTIPCDCIDAPLTDADVYLFDLDDWKRCAGYEEALQRLTSALGDEAVQYVAPPHRHLLEHARLAWAEQVYDLLYQMCCEGELIATLPGNGDLSPSGDTCLALFCFISDFPEFRPLFPALLRVDSSIVMTVCLGVRPLQGISPANFYTHLHTANMSLTHLDSFVTEQEKRLHVVSYPPKRQRRYMVAFDFIKTLIIVEFIRRVLVGDSSFVSTLANHHSLFNCPTASYVRSLQCYSTGVYEALGNTLRESKDLGVLFCVACRRLRIPCVCLDLSDRTACAIYLEGIWYLTDVEHTVIVSRLNSTGLYNVPLDLCQEFFPPATRIHASLLRTAEVQKAVLGKYNMDFLEDSCLFIGELQDALNYLSSLSNDVFTQYIDVLDVQLASQPRFINFAQQPNVLALKTTKLSQFPASPSIISTPQASIRIQDGPQNMTEGEDPQPTGDPSSDTDEPQTPILKPKLLKRSTTFIQAPHRTTLSQAVIEPDSRILTSIRSGILRALQTGRFYLTGWIVSQEKISEAVIPINIDGSQLEALRYTLYGLIERVLCDMRVDEFSIEDKKSMGARGSTQTKRSRPDVFAVAPSHISVRLERGLFYRAQLFKDPYMAREPFIAGPDGPNLLTPLIHQSDVFSTCITRLRALLDSHIFDNHVRFLLVFDNQGFSGLLTERDEQRLLHNVDKLTRAAFGASKFAQKEAMTRKARVIIGGAGRIYVLLEAAKLLRGS
ncbi:hypothetical protein GMRT_11380 [Giardia muris]|uniref:Uncharacterized protein n=1 Tax=Giardia muris TaxID=5742 RepID=A0A4Z1T043_GIAMU|nr:hypothetical protein GMRT_11380 [Giardia muris]|eukprot:TNJ30355.1 hypothetical protein GMRT_11380 [Giardia muris]